jgi:hypothetical protein
MKTSSVEMSSTHTTSISKMFSSFIAMTGNAAITPRQDRTRTISTIISHKETNAIKH